MSQDYTQSVYRENLLEHLLIGELLKHAWLKRGAELEVSFPAVDRSGHDIILEANGVTRHVQLKSSGTDAATRSQTIHIQLAQKPSGCVIWTKFSKELQLDHFLFFGGAPGEPLDSLDGLKTAKHTKGNAQGVKKERLNLRVVPRSAFARIDDVAALYEHLFGQSAIQPAPRLSASSDDDIEDSD